MVGALENKRAPLLRKLRNKKIREKGSRSSRKIFLFLYSYKKLVQGQVESIHHIIRRNFLNLYLCRIDRCTCINQTNLFLFIFDEYHFIQ